MKSIREILDKYADNLEISDGSVTMYGGKVIDEEDFDKLTEDFEELMEDIINEFIMYGRTKYKIRKSNE